MKRLAVPPPLKGQWEKTRVGPANGNCLGMSVPLGYSQEVKAFMLIVEFMNNWSSCRVHCGHGFNEDRVRHLENSSRLPCLFPALVPPCPRGRAPVRPVAGGAPPRLPSLLMWKWASLVEALERVSTGRCQTVGGHLQPQRDSHSGLWLLQHPACRLGFLSPKS